MRQIAWAFLKEDQMMEKSYKGSVIGAVKGDLSRFEGVDVLVLGADTTLYLDSGVCKAIHNVAGPELYEAVMKLGGCELGEARITPAFNAPSKAIVHVAAPRWEGGDSGEESLLYSCYKNIALLTDSNGYTSAAMPALGTGVYKWPIDLAIRTGLKAVTDFIDSHPGKSYRFVWVLFDDATTESYEKGLEEYFG